VPRGASRPPGRIESDDLIHVKSLSATEAARRFSDLLDAVENRGETFVVVRRGQPVARIGPPAGGAGRSVKELLRRAPRNDGWLEDLEDVRSLIIAATALARRRAIVSAEARAFADLPGVAVRV
jgi:prevent-host-death family protein